MKTLDELAEKFKDWSLKDDTHLQWQLNLMGRFAQNERDWYDALHRHAPYAAEAKADFMAIFNRMMEVFNETRELCDQLAKDKQELYEIFELLGKEFEKLPHDPS